MVLIIDNYDSFTYNLARYFEELGQQVKVVKNDQISLSELASGDFTHLVISPGPCTPNEAGISLQAITRLAGKLPILGVCLGHQAIAQAYGAKIEVAKFIKHGKTSLIKVAVSNSVLFEDCEPEFQATRYHSLLVDSASLNCDFIVSAYSETQGTQEIMAIENHKLRLYGLQYHPESLLTDNGHKVLDNFLTKG